MLDKTQSRGPAGKSPARGGEYKVLRGTAVWPTDLVRSPSSAAKRPAPARPTMPPPQLSGTRSSPPAPPLSPGSSSPVTPRALPRRLVGSSLRAPTVPPPLPPVPPQPARRQSRRSPASPSLASPGPASPDPVSISLPAQVDLGATTEDRGVPEAAAAGPTPPAVPPQPRRRGLASETN